MKKQYRVTDAIGFKKDVWLYKDGNLIEVKNLWIDEAYNFTDKLEQDGYTIGYLPEEVEQSRKQYEYRKRNEIAAAR